jgi:glycosyltransferase involved in cell wall biosynthesis
MIASSLPKVSIVMAARNAERHLQEAIDSILCQTLTEFELIIVDDASTDETSGMLEDYAARDSRVRVLRNEVNHGLTWSLNRGLEAARAPIIARMDADDISSPRRLERQVRFLDMNPEHLLVATSYRAIDDEGRTLYVKVKPADDFAVRWLSRFRMCFEHPSACFRAHFPDGNPVRYNEGFGVGQDFELFARLMAGGKAAILPEVLFHYRRHPANLSSTRRQEQKANNMRVALQIQERELPRNLVGRLNDLLRCYLLGEAATSAIVRNSVGAFDRMLAYDIASNPDAKQWLRRQAAEILADATLRQGAGFGDLRVIAAFVVHGRNYLWPLVCRVLEDKGYLPCWLESFPDPETAPANCDRH